MHILYNADNLHPVVIPPARVKPFDPFPYGIVATPVTTRHGLIDDHHWRGVFCVLIIEEAAPNQGHTQRLKVVPADSRPFHGRPLLPRLQWAPLHRAKPKFRIIAREEHCADRAGCSHSRQTPDASHRFSIERCALIARKRVTEPKRGSQHAVGAESRIDRLHGHKTTDQQTGPRKQDNRECNLRYDENPAHPARIDSAGLLPVAHLSGNLHRRREPEQQSGCEGQTETKYQHGPINVRLSQPGDPVRSQGNQCAYAQGRKWQTQRSRKAGEQHTLRHQLPKDAPFVRAKRGP